MNTGTSVGTTLGTRWAIWERDLRDVSVAEACIWEHIMLAILR